MALLEAEGSGSGRWVLGPDLIFPDCVSGDIQGCGATSLTEPLTLSPPGKLLAQASGAGLWAQVPGPAPAVESLGSLLVTDERTGFCPCPLG